MMLTLGAVLPAGAGPTELSTLLLPSTWPAAGRPADLAAWVGYAAWAWSQSGCTRSPAWPPGILAVGLLPLWQILHGGPVTFSGAAFPLGVLLRVETGCVVVALAKVQAGERDAGLVAAVVRRQAAAIASSRAEIDRSMAGLPALVFHRDCAADGTSRRGHRGGDIAVVTGWPPTALAGMDSPVPLALAEMSFAGCLARMLRDDTLVVEGQNRPPDRAGCGRRELDGTVRRQLGGKVSLAQGADGLSCALEVPLAPAAAAHTLRTKFRPAARRAEAPNGARRLCGEAKPRGGAAPGV
ncbi:MAG: hypothetical protein ACOYOH_05675 [Paracraurococcus sp.]